MAQIYNYTEAIKNDILFWLNHEADDFKADHADECGRWLRPDNIDEIADEMNDILFCDDSVTGNGSGSYFCNASSAADALAHNWDLLADALDEFGGGSDIIRKGVEAADVTIRCYLLSSCIWEVLNELV